MTPEMLSEDQPVETGDPFNPTDVAGEFDAMTGATPTPEPLEAEETPALEPETSEAPETVEEVIEEVAEELATEPEENEVATLRQQLTRMEAEMATLRSQGPSQAPTIADVMAPYQPEPPQEVLQNKAFLGIAPGETPAGAYEAVFGYAPQSQENVEALNGLCNRIRRSVIRDMFMLMPHLQEGYLQNVMQKAQLDSQFQAANKDLDDVKDIVVALGQQLKEAKPYLTPDQFNKELSNLVRTKLKRPRTPVKSGGTRHNLPPQKGKAKPALAGGTGVRRAPSTDTPLQSEFNAMRRVVEG